MWLIALAGYPDDVEPDDLVQIAHDALGETGELYIVEQVG